MFFAEFNEKEEARLRSLFKEDPEQIRKDMEYLGDWLQKQPHLPHDMDNTMLLNFLRGRKYSLEDTKERIDRFYTYKGMLPELSANLDPLSPDMKRSMDNMIACVLPGYTAEGYRVFIFSFKNVDPENYDYDVVARRGFCSYDVTLASDTLKRGLVIILDCTEFKLGHAMKITIPQVKKALTLVQEGYPHQAKKIYVFGLRPVAVKFANISLQFLKEEMRKRVELLVESNVEEMYKVIPQKMLPKEYGGSAGPSFEINERWNKELISRRKFLTEMGKKKSDESRRPGKPKEASEILGIEGSFRQLAVD